MAPINDLGLVDLEPGVVVRGEARNLTDCAIDVDRATAFWDEAAAQELVVATADAQLPRVEDDLHKLTAPDAVTAATGIRNVIVDLREFLKPFAAEP